MRILVTGATGYVGSWTVNALADPPGPVAGALRTGLDILVDLTPTGRPA